MVSAGENRGPLGLFSVDIVDCGFGVFFPLLLLLLLLLGGVAGLLLLLASRGLTGAGAGLGKEDV